MFHASACLSPISITINYLQLLIVLNDYTDRLHCPVEPYTHDLEQKPGRFAMLKPLEVYELRPDNLLCFEFFSFYSLRPVGEKVHIWSASDLYKGK